MSTTASVMSALTTGAVRLVTSRLPFQVISPETQPARPVATGQVGQHLIDLQAPGDQGQIGVEGSPAWTPRRGWSACPAGTCR